jgi:hypothetical protein
MEAGMGNFYTSIALRGPDQDQALAALKAQGRIAYISPTENGFAIVCDEETESQDDMILTDLASDLSDRLQCVALAVLNHDDDILAYWLFEKGEFVDDYDSCPGYFEGDDSGPEGGDAEKLCRALGAAGRAAEVQAILSNTDDYLFAIERHGALAEVLGLPSFSVGLGYDYIAADEIEGIDPAAFKHT